MRDISTHNTSGIIFIPPNQRYSSDSVIFVFKASLRQEGAFKTDELEAAGMSIHDRIFVTIFLI